MSHLHDLGELRPALIVAPVAVIANWQRELRRFAPGIPPAHEHRGSQRERHDPLSLARHEVVITSYSTLRRDQLLLGRIDWSVVACDEAQYVKNPTAGVTSAVKGMKARFRLACTGTPVENGLSELWCIVDFVQPGRLGSRNEFRREFEQPLVAATEGEADATELVGRLRSRLNPHYIRRTKEEVLDLPPKTEQSYEVAMSFRQAALYEEVLTGVMERSVHPLAGLQHLITICSHPLAIDHTASGESPGRLLEDAPKLEQTVGILESVRKQGEKVVIYTRLRAMQRILQVVLRYRFGFEPRVLNGLVTGHNRHRIIDAFNDRPGFDVMILSPEAAGVGLNITGATHVIHYTRLWNPAKENQATDRVHRIGQELPVSVHYPVVTGNGFKSVEQHLHDLLMEKLELARNVLAPRKASTSPRNLRDGLSARPTPPDNPQSPPSETGGRGVHPRPCRRLPIPQQVRTAPVNRSRNLEQFSRYFGTLHSAIGQRQVRQIVQSWLYLVFAREPGKWLRLREIPQLGDCEEIRGCVNYRESTEMRTCADTVFPEGYVMREVQRSQAWIGQVPVDQIEIDPTCRDDNPALLKGLQDIWSNEPVRERLFDLLDQNILPKTDRTVGRPPGMELWQILVLGVLKQGLNCDFDRIHHIANNCNLVRQFLGHGVFDSDKRYKRQTIMDNVSYLTPELLDEVNQIVVERGHEVARKGPDETLRGRCDSFVVETDVHHPTDLNLLWDATRWRRERAAGFARPARLQNASSWIDGVSGGI